MKTILKFIPINRQPLGIILLVLFVGFLSCKKNDSTVMNTTVNYSGSFVKSTSTVVTSATGTVTAKFDPTTLVLTYTVTWSGLSANAAAMHFHDAGPVIAPITGFTAGMSGTFSSTVTLTAAQATDLAAGKIYVQIHTSINPGGEVLATLIKGSTNTTATTTGGGYMY
jgi:hypothetical protein